MLFPLKKISWLLIIIILNLLTISCSQSKTSECKRLRKVVNESNELLTQTHSQTQGNNPQDNLAKLAKISQSISADFAALELIDTELQGFQQRYQEMFDELDISSRNLIEALENEDSKAAQTARKDMEKAANDDQYLTDEVKSYCASPVQ